jgi:hypothetical protein
MMRNALGQAITGFGRRLGLVEDDDKLLSPMPNRTSQPPRKTNPIEEQSLYRLFEMYRPQQVADVPKPQNYVYDRVGDDKRVTGGQSRWVQPTPGGVSAGESRFRTEASLPQAASNAIKGVENAYQQVLDYVRNLGVSEHIYDQEEYERQEARKRQGRGQDIGYIGPREPIPTTTPTIQPEITPTMVPDMPVQTEGRAIPTPPPSWEFAIEDKSPFPDEWQEYVMRAAEKYGIDPLIMASILAQEVGGYGYRPYDWRNNEILPSWDEARARGLIGRDGEIGPGQIIPRFHPAPEGVTDEEYRRLLYSPEYNIDRMANIISRHLGGGQNYLSALSRYGPHTAGIPEGGTDYARQVLQRVGRL